MDVRACLGLSRASLSDASGAAASETERAPPSRVDSCIETADEASHEPDVKNQTQRQAVHRDPLDPTSLPKGRVEVLFVDHEGTLWISTWVDGGGLSRFDAETETFTYYPHNPVNAEGSGVVGGRVNVITEDRQGRLWIGTNSGAVSRFDPDGETVTYFFDDPANQDNSTHNSIRALYADTHGDLWIGTGEPFASAFASERTGGGLLRFDPEIGNYHRYKHDPDDEQSLLDDRIGAIMEDHAGNDIIA